jgi:uncharacterized protein
MTDESMRTEHVTFFSEGKELGALWRTPANDDGPFRAIVQGPGWLGTKDTSLYVPYHRAMIAAGLGVLVIDHRGFGRNDAPEELTVAGQIQDLRNAVSYLASRSDVIPGAFGAFGNGATGGGNAILLGATDHRIRCIVSQFPVADGTEWLRGMRAADQWGEFLAELETDRVRRASTGVGVMVDPATEITVASAERALSGVKKDIADAVPKRASLSVADELLAYRPLDVVNRITAPTLFITVENDLVTPDSHTRWLYDAARCEKKLIVQRDVSHYASYTKYGELITAEVAEWFDRNISVEPFMTSSEPAR